MASLSFENLVKDLFIKSLYKWASVIGLLGIYVFVAVWLTDAPAYYPLHHLLSPEQYQILRLGAFIVAGGIVLIVFTMRRRYVTPRRIGSFAHMDAVIGGDDWNHPSRNLDAGETRALALVQDLMARDVTHWGLAGWIALVGVTLFMLSGLLMDLALYIGMSGTALVLIRPYMPRINLALARYRVIERELDKAGHDTNYPKTYAESSTPSTTIPE